VDFTAPSVPEVLLTSSTSTLQFQVRAVDDSGTVSRVVVLYLRDGDTTWSRAELTLNPGTGYFEANVTPVGGLIHYFAQAADPSGNVAVALNNGNYFQALTPEPTLARFFAPASVNVGSPILLSLEPASVDVSPLFAFDCGNGVFGSFSPVNNTSCPTNENGPLTVRGQVQGAVLSTFTATVTVNDIAPTATFVAPSTVTAGDSFTLSLVNPFDPSNGDTNAGFLYAFDCGDGGDYGALSSNPSRNCPTPAASGTRTVRGKIQDQGGLASEYTTVVGVVSGAPVATTTPATDVTADGATLNGTVNARGASTSVTFEWGTTAGGPYPNTETATPDTVSGTSTTPVSTALTGLTPNTTYYYRVVATNSAGTTFGNEQSFTTLAAPPTATTDPATNVTDGGATLNGTVNANGSSTSVAFAWGTTAGGPYPNTATATPDTVTGTSDTPVSAVLGGLTPNTPYYYRVAATNAAGTVNGGEQSFTTTALPITTAAITGTPHPGCPSDFFSGQATVTLSTNVPVQSTQYRLTPFGGAPGSWLTYIGPFLVVSEGPNLVEFYSISLGGGVEPTQSVTVNITTFTQTAVLDNFNRADGRLGRSWSGSVGAYRIVGNQVDVTKDGPIYWRTSTPFGVNQEAYVTLTTVDADGPEQAVLLKVQGTLRPQWDQGVMEVLYDGLAGAVRVETFRLGSTSWTVYANTPVTFQNGDRLGARVLASGQVWIYKNCLLVSKTTLNTSDQTFFNGKGGWIGMWFVNSRDAYLDDFGGGTVTALPVSAPRKQE
jgi:hypothetical protein